MSDKKQCPGGNYQSSPGDKIKSSRAHKSSAGKRLDSNGGSHKRGKQG